MEPSSEPRRHAVINLLYRMDWLPCTMPPEPWLTASSARQERRLGCRDPPGTPHRSRARLGHSGRSLGAHQGPAGAQDGSVRGTDCTTSRVNYALGEQTVFNNV